MPYGPEKNEIKKEERKLYSQSGLNYDKPWKVYNKNEGTINFTIYIHTYRKPFDLLQVDKK